VIHARTNSCALRQQKSRVRFRFRRTIVARLRSVPMTARGVCVGRRTVVPWIGIDEAIPGIETIVACPGAPVAPIPVAPCRPDVPNARPVPGSEVRCLGRGVRKDESTRRNCGGKCQPFDTGDMHVRTRTKVWTSSVSTNQKPMAKQPDWLSIGSLLSLMVSNSPRFLRERLGFRKHIDDRFGHRVQDQHLILHLHIFVVT